MSNNRLLFIDNIRILLIVLVILVHLAITYGAPVGSWYYHEGQPGMIESIFYVFFLAVNQSFFMGIFFMISGYFTPGSYDRKGARAFIKDRLLRLGVPLLLYIIFIDPLIEYELALSKGFTGSFLDFLGLYVDGYNGLGSGPLWFVEALLIFAAVYALWRLLVKSAGIESKVPRNVTIAIFGIILGIITFIVRIWFPLAGFSVRIVGTIPWCSYHHSFDSLISQEIQRSGKIGKSDVGKCIYGIYFSRFYYCLTRTQSSRFDPGSSSQICIGRPHGSGSLFLIK